MKKITFTVLAFVFVFGGVCAADDRQNIFAVEADAIIRVQPDKVVLNVGIITKGKNLQETKTKNSDIIKKAIEYCKKAGIQEKNIQTDYINMRPEFRNYETYETHFIIEQNLSVILEDVSKYEEVLTELINLGMNCVNGIDFQVNDLKKYRNEARKAGIAAAKEKAELLSQEAGIKLGKIINVRDYNTHWFPFGRTGRNAAMSNVSQNIVQSGTGASSGSGDQDSLALGMVSVRSAIVLSYEIK